jgi:hypothetical protein
LTFTPYSNTILLFPLYSLQKKSARKKAFREWAEANFSEAPQSSSYPGRTAVGRKNRYKREEEGRGKEKPKLQGAAQGSRTSQKQKQKAGARVCAGGKNL